MKSEDNYNEYLRLLQNSDYIDVTYDDKSGGVSAVHKRHKFDKQIGAYGVLRGDYEREALKVLRESGFRVVLESELSSPGKKICDGYLDDIPMEIKAIEGNGTWTISTKLRNAVKQHARCVVLYFPEKERYSSFRVNEGIRLFQSSSDYTHTLRPERIMVIVRDKLERCQ